MTEHVSVADDMQASGVLEEQTTTPADRRITLWRLLIVGLLIVFIGFLVVGLTRSNKSDWRASGIAPDFTLTTFDGKTLHLADLKGKGVVVNFGPVGVILVATKPNC